MSRPEFKYIQIKGLLYRTLNDGRTLEPISEAESDALLDALSACLESLGYTCSLDWDRVVSDDREGVEEV